MGLSAYTVLIMHDGGEKRAEDISTGDELREALTGDGMLVTTTLNSPGVGMVRVTAGEDIILDLTGDHNLLTDSGMIAANRIAPGTGLRTAEGFVPCTAADALFGDYMVYDVKVESEPQMVPWALANGLVVEVRQ